MPLKLWDFQCKNCESVFEDIVEAGIFETECKTCGMIAERIFTPSGCFTANQDANWIRSVLEVVNKDDKSLHVQSFLKNPTRDNYKAWMKGEGIRPAEIGTSQHGEEYESRQARKSRDEAHENHMTDAVMRKRQRDKRIEI